jgi:hypothetical protein
MSNEGKEGNGAGMKQMTGEKGKNVRARLVIIQADPE